MTIGKKLVVPTRLCPSPDELPLELIREWEICLQAIERCRSELKMTEANEKVDVKTGVARDLEGKSVAFLDITVVQAENLPLRSHHTQDVIDPLVRVFLRPEHGAKNEYEDAWEFFTEPRLSDMNPIWDTFFQLHRIPSTKGEIGIQVIDNLRSEVAGEVSIPLRSLLDQKEHDQWFILPPTLRQQVMEQKNPRKIPARIRLLLKLTHTKSILLTRELQQQVKAREVILRKRRDYIQEIFQLYLNRISSK